MLHENYNSHFIQEDGQVVLNPNINQQILQRLYILQKQVYQQYYFCGCGSKDSIFFSLRQFKDHIKSHIFLPFSSYFSNKPAPILTNLKINQWKIQFKKRQLEEACFSLEKTDLSQIKPDPIHFLPRNTKYKKNIDNMNVLREGKFERWYDEHCTKKTVFCDACKIFFFSKKPINRTIEVRKHFQLHKTNQTLKISTIETEYHKMLEEIRSKKFVLIKCQCSKTLFPNLLAYKEHVDTFHQGITLPLSSHILIEN